MSAPWIGSVSYDDAAKAYLAASDHYLGQKPPAGAYFAIAVRRRGLSLFADVPTGEGPYLGLCVVGRPTARELPQDGTWAQVTRMHLLPGAPLRVEARGDAHHLPRPHASHRVHLPQGWVPKERRDEAEEERRAGVGESHGAHGRIRRSEHDPEAAMGLRPRGAWLGRAEASSVTDPDAPREVAARYVERLHAMGHPKRKAYCRERLRHDGCAVCERSAARDDEGIGEEGER